MGRIRRTKTHEPSKENLDAASFLTTARNVQSSVNVCIYVIYINDAIDNLSAAFAALVERGESWNVNAGRR